MPIYSRLFTLQSVMRRPLPECAPAEVDTRFYRQTSERVSGLYLKHGINVTGTENILDEPVLVAFSHRGTNDIVGAGLAYQPSLLNKQQPQNEQNPPVERPLVFVAKDSLFLIPGLATIMKKTGVIPVNRQNPQQETLHAMTQTLLHQPGFNVAIAPEGGTRTGNRIDKLTRGVGIVACLARRKIQPVGIKGSERYRRLLIPVELSIHIGKAFEPEKIDVEYSPQLDLSVGSRSESMNQILLPASRTTRNLRIKLQEAYDTANGS